MNSNMTGQSTGQPTLLEMAELEGRAEVSSAIPEMPVRSLGPELTASSACELRPLEAEPFQAISPLANLPLHEVCAFCGVEVRAPGFVIQGCEELGVFCNEECGDKRFRLNLNDTAYEDSRFDDEKPND